MENIDVHEILGNHDHPLFRVLGQYWFYLLTTRNQWIFRRVHTLRLFEERGFQSRISLDFKIPLTYLRGLGLGSDSGILVTELPIPLLVMAKEPLRGFSLCDESGGSVSVFNREQNGQAAYAMMAWAFLQLTKLPSVPEEVQVAITNVVVEDSVDINESREIWRPYLEGSPEDGRNFEAFEELANSLDGHFMLMGVFETSALERRRIVKITYEERDKTELSLPQRLGIMPSYIINEEPERESAGSVHFEFRAPYGLDAIPVLVRDGEDVSFVPFGRSQGHSIASVVLSSGQSKDVKDETQPIPGVAKVVFALRPSADGLLHSVFLVTLFASAISFLFLRFCSELKNSNSADSGLLLLLIPGLLGAVLARPGEHAFASLRLRWVRAASLLSSILLFLTAGLLVLPWSPTGTSHMLWIISIMSLVPLFYIILVWSRINEYETLRDFFKSWLSRS